MGFIPTKISFVISKVDLVNTLTGISVDLKTTEDKDITVLRLINLGTSELRGGLTFYDYGGYITLYGRPHKVKDGVLVSGDNGENFVGSFVLEIYPDDNLSETTP